MQHADAALYEPRTADVTASRSSLPRLTNPRSTN